MDLSSKGIRALAFRRRVTLACLTVLLTLMGAIPMARSFSHDGWSVLKVAFMVLFVLLLTQVAFSFTVAVLGWWLLRRGSDPVRINSREMSGATVATLPAVAVVMPIHNEEVGRVFQGVRAMYESLQQTGQGEGFDFFILSDTSETNCWIEEEKAWFELCKQVGGFGRIFYRKRRVTLHNKSGNVADFCRRWGEIYRYMIVLDADSLMTGSTMVRLTALMEQHAGVGIIQTSPQPVLGRSLFQRVEQFASFVYRPIYTAGANYWQLGEATFWGHNAIIRVKPFMQYCAMPELPEVGPLGTRVLSHDTIEAAMMERAGYAVWQAYELGGTYEELPPHLLASLQRDRRWCHGNLQHIWFLFERGLRPASRMNILNGIMAYGSSPLWFLSIALGVLIAIENESGSGARKETVFTSGIIYACVMLLLLLPKILGASLLMKSPEKIRLCGGRARVLLSTLLETVYAMLLSPILMLFYTRFVLASFCGFKVVWRRQVRSDEKGPKWGEWLSVHWANTLFALAFAGIVVWRAPALLFWLLPVLAGLILAIPFSRITASYNLGSMTRANGLFVIPEETETGVELKQVEEPFLMPANPFFRARGYAVDYGLLQAVLDPYINAIHVSMLHQHKEPGVRTRDYMAMLVDRLLLDGPLGLTPSEKRILLSDAESMMAAHQKLWSSPPSYLHDWWQAAFRRYNETNALSIRRAVNV